MKKSIHSEFGKLLSVWVKEVGDAFISEEKLTHEWRSNNFLQKPDLAQSIVEYAGFLQLLINAGVQVHKFKRDPSLSIDSIYCRDASIATDYGIILCQMGKAGRIGEPSSNRKIFEAMGFPVFGQIEPPGTLESGDTAWLDTMTLAVGHSYRTNSLGIEQLRNMLKPKGIEVLTVSLPHYKGPSDVFHLMSVFSPVDSNLAVVYSPLMPVAFRQELIQRGFELVEVPEKEFDSMGCNVLAIAPRKCIMLKGNPTTRSALIKAGCEVMEYTGYEISIKGGGGPTCLTRPMMRELNQDERYPIS